MSDCIVVNKEKCIGCGMCAKDCPNHAIEITDGKADMVAETCLECGHCVAVCPKAAITMAGYNMEEVKDYDEDSFSINSENFLNAIKYRRSIRRFKKIDVEQEKIKQIIEAGRYTPTGSNKQNVRYVVMNHPEQSIEKYGIATFKKLLNFGSFMGKFLKIPIDLNKFSVEEGFFFHDAPTVIFVISKDKVNASLASENMEMMAESLGLGVLFVGLFVRASRINRKIRKKLHISGKETLVTAIALGYPAVRYQRTTPKKPAKVDWE